MKHLQLLEILVICLCTLFVIQPETGFAQTEEVPSVLVLNSYLRESPNVPMFNYAQLQRFGLAPSDLPAGTILLNEPDTFYDQYKNYIFGALIFISVQMLIIIALWINITRRKQAEEALAEERNLLRTVIDNLPDCIYAKDTENRFVIGNIAVARVMGVATPDELLGKRDFDFFPQELAEQYCADEQEIIRSGEPLINREEPLMDQTTGRKGWSSTTKVPLRDNCGEIVGIVGIGHDITERKRAEEALKESEGRLSTFINSATNAFTIWDADLNLIDLNQTAATYLPPGTKKEDLLGTSITKLVPDLKITGHYDRYMEVIRTGNPISFEEHVLYQGYGDKILNVRAFKVGDGLGIMTTDITERKRAEEALGESQANLSALIENTDGSIWSVDRDYRLIVGNSVFHQNVHAGRGRPFAPGNSVLADDFPPETLNEWCGYYDRALRGERFSVETQRGFVDTSRRYMEYRFNPIHAADGSVAGVTVFGRDITEHKRTEEQLKQALAEKTTLLQELYHRTKNNMQVIHSMLALRSLYVQDEQLLTVLEEVQDKIHAMALVHQKLYESRNLSSIDLKEYIEDLMAYLGQSYQVQANRISFDLDTDSVLVLIDTAIPCGLVLSELISNVFKHAFPGDRVGRISIQLHRAEDETITLQVSDNGIGVPGDFDVRRSDSLGLQTVMGIVEHQLQGEITVDTDHGLAWQIRFRDNLYRLRV